MLYKINDTKNFIKSRVLAYACSWATGLENRFCIQTYKAGCIDQLELYGYIQLGSSYHTQRFFFLVNLRLLEELFIFFIESQHLGLQMSTTLSNVFQSPIFSYLGGNVNNYAHLLVHQLSIFLTPNFHSKDEITIKQVLHIQFGWFSFIHLLLLLPSVFYRVFPSSFSMYDFT